jgi:hypothetical protein
MIEHLLKCKTCKYFEDYGYPNRICTKINVRLTGIEINLISEVGCASHSETEYHNKC